MALYSKKQYEHELEAVNAASSCISAAVAGSQYGGRLEPYVDDYVNIVEYFWARCPITRKKLDDRGPDAREVARIFLSLYRGDQLKGMAEINGIIRNTPAYYESVLERVRRKLRGKSLGTRFILMDNDKKSKCNDPEHHTQPCRCKGLTLFRLAQAQEAME